MKKLKNLIGFSFGPLISLVIGFLSVPIITRIVTPAEYGYGVLFLIITNLIFIVSSLGMDQSFIRYYYEEKNKLKLFIQCIMISLFGGVLTTIVLFVFKDYIISIFFEKLSLKEQFLTYSCLVSSIFINTFFRFFQLIIRMEQKGAIFSLTQIALKSFEITFFFIFLHIFSNHIYALVLSQIMNIAIVLIFLYPIVFKILFKSTHDKKNIFKKSFEDKHQIKSMVKYGAPFIGTLLLAWSFQFIDRTLLSLLSNSKQVGLYSSAFKISSLLVSIQVIFTTYWIPMVLKKVNSTNFNAFLLKSLNIITPIVIFIGLLLMVLKESIVNLFGGDFAEASILIPFVLAFPIMYTISEITSIGILIGKKTVYSLYINLITLIVGTLLNFHLIDNYGGVGAAIGTSIIYLVFYILRTIYGLKSYRFNINKSHYAMIAFFYISLFYDLYFHLNNLVEYLCVFLMFLIILLFNLKSLRSLKNNEE